MMLAMAKAIAGCLSPTNRGDGPITADLVDTAELRLAGSQAPVFLVNRSLAANVGGLLDGIGISAGALVFLVSRSPETPAVTVARAREFFKTFVAPDNPPRMMNKEAMEKIIEVL